MTTSLRGVVDGDSIREEEFEIDESTPLYWMEVENEIVENVFCPTGEGGGVDPTCSPGGSAGGHKMQIVKPEGGKPFLAPSGKDVVNVIKDLPGSTHPKLVEDSVGKKWVMKTLSKERLQNEADADAVYQALGIPSARSVVTVDGTKFSEYIENGQTLADWRSGKSDPEIEAMHAEIAKGFAADALLANWDVIGLTSDNIMIKDGVPHRVDNGGAMKYRAQGNLKGAKFGSTVGELKTLRDPSLNESSAKVFKGLTDADIKDQIKDVVAQKDVILSRITDPQTKAIIGDRIKYLDATLESKEPVDLVAKKVEALASSPPPGGLSTPQGLGSHIQTLGADSGVKFSKLQIAKIEALNPHGMKGGVVNVPSFTGDKAAMTAKLDFLKKVLPPGTVIKVKHVTSKAIGKEHLSIKHKPGMQMYKAGTEYKNVGESSNDKAYVEGSYWYSVTNHPSGKGSSYKIKEVSPNPSEKSQKEWKKSMTDSEKNAISHWKGSATGIRKSVASGKPDSTAKAFLSAIEKVPPYQGVLYRGVHGEYADNVMKQIKEMGVGSGWVDPSPHGFSLRPHRPFAVSSAGKLVFRAKVKTARPIVKSDGFSSDDVTDEAEVIGLPGTKYRVVGIHENVHVEGPGLSSGVKIEMMVDLEEI